MDGETVRKEFGPMWVLLSSRKDPRTKVCTQDWAPVQEAGALLAWVNTDVTKLMLPVSEVLAAAEKQSEAKGFARLTSPPLGIAADLFAGHVVTLDDGTSFQLVQYDLVADIQP